MRLAIRHSKPGTNGTIGRQTTCATTYIPILPCRVFRFSHAASQYHESPIWERPMLLNPINLKIFRRSRSGGIHVQRMRVGIRSVERIPGVGSRTFVKCVGVRRPVSDSSCAGGRARREQTASRSHGAVECDSRPSTPVPSHCIGVPVYVGRKGWSRSIVDIRHQNTSRGNELIQPFIDWFKGLIGPGNRSCNRINCIRKPVYQKVAFPRTWFVKTSVARRHAAVLIPRRTRAVEICAAVSPAARRRSSGISGIVYPHRMQVDERVVPNWGGVVVDERRPATIPKCRSFGRRIGTSEIVIINFYRPTASQLSPSAGRVNIDARNAHCVIAKHHPAAGVAIADERARRRPIENIVLDKQKIGAAKVRVICP